MWDKKILQWTINILAILVMTAYGFIFTSIIARIDSNEAKINALNPVLIEIKTKLSGIEVDLMWIKENLKDKVNKEQ